MKIKSLIKTMAGNNRVMVDLAYYGSIKNFPVIWHNEKVMQLAFNTSGVLSIITYGVKDVTVQELLSAEKDLGERTYYINNVIWSDVTGIQQDKKVIGVTEKEPNHINIQVEREREDE